MRPIVTPQATLTYDVPEGMANCEPLQVERRASADGYPVLVSTWELSEVERAQIAAGGRVELWVWGFGQPPVTLQVIR